MVEELIEKQAGMSWRRRLLIAGISVAVLVVIGVGLNTILSGIMKGHKAGSGKPAAAGSGAVTTAKGGPGDSLSNITDASFGYLLPGASSAWTVQGGSKTYDSKKGLVKYNVKLTNAGTLVTVSQQVMPADLLPRDSAAFNQFMESNKPTRSADAGGGKLYFLPALQNGSPAAGADTVIFATDNVLLFGRAESVVGWDGWTKMMAAMKPAF
jgi:hypothetical protein